MLSSESGLARDADCRDEGEISLKLRIGAGMTRIIAAPF
jgi:hypothetical protein